MVKIINKILVISLLTVYIAISLGKIASVIYQVYGRSPLVLSYIYILWAIIIVPFLYLCYLIWNWKTIPENGTVKKDNPNNKPSSVTFGKELTDEDKIIFEHLSKRHEDLFSFVDALDSKLAQIIALNGLILSFVFYRGNEATMPSVFILGLFVIVSSILIGVLGYCCQEFSAGLSSNFFREYKGFDSGKGFSILYDRLIKGIEKNTKAQSIKAQFFNYMLILNITGLIILVVGYYA